MPYFTGIKTSLSRVLSAILFGDPDWTLSSKAYMTASWLEPIIDFIFWPYERNHCKKTFEWEQQFK